MDIRYDYYNDSSGRNVKHFLLANLPKINGTIYGNSQQTTPLIPPLPQGRDVVFSTECPPSGAAFLETFHR